MQRPGRTAWRPGGGGLASPKDHPFASPESALFGGTISLPRDGGPGARRQTMKLVTYSRDGNRRLGAWIDEGILDLPDAVGHPAFPTTMESLLQRNGGTVLEAVAA